MGRMRFTAAVRSPERSLPDAAAACAGGEVELFDLAAADGGKFHKPAVRLGDEAVGFRQPEATIETLQGPLGRRVRGTGRCVTVVPQPDDRGAVA